MFDTRVIAERKIEEAIEEGAFDNLPGKGKPLVLDDDPSTPLHLKLANKVLRNANVLPDWVQLNVEIREGVQECSRLWERTAGEYSKRLAKLHAAADRAGDLPRAEAAFVQWYTRSHQAYVGAMKRVNTDILKSNMMQPMAPGVLIPYRIAEETARFEEHFPPPAGFEPPQPASGPGPLTLRAVAVETYLARLRKTEP